jgi:LysM repeat protein
MLAPVAGRFYGARMKKSLAIFTLLAGLMLPAAAQDAEELKRLNATVEELIANQAAQQKRLQELALENDQLRRELTKLAEATSAQDKAQDKYATRDDVKLLTVKLKEVDQARLDDRKLILEEIRKAAKAPVAAPKRPTPKEAPATSGPPEGAFEYVIQPGDTLSGIATGVNKEHGLKVTVDAILKANPKLDPKRMQVGQKIYIPGK